MDDADNGCAEVHSMKNQFESNFDEENTVSTDSDHSTNNRNQIQFAEENDERCVPLQSTNIHNGIINANTYFDALVEKEKRLDNSIGLFQDTLNNKTMTINKLEQEKKFFEDKVEDLEKELSRVKAESRRKMKDQGIFEAELEELTKTMSTNKLEYKSKTEEILKKVDIIRVSLVKSETNVH